MSRIVAKHPADDKHQVVTVEGGRDLYRKTPCGGCPWRRENVGNFPAQAFRISAPTSWDVPDLVFSGAQPSVFACHESGTAQTATCAGFLLSTGAQHNLALRLRGVDQKRKPIAGVTAGGADLFESYRQMAEANGVDPADATLGPCR